TLPHWIKYTKRRCLVMNPVGDISVIKAILFKSHEKTFQKSIGRNNGSRVGWALPTLHPSEPQISPITRIKI
ncbi:MAG: hypothetical protein AAB332_02790, partial [Planctomycetota bacterium]